MQYSLKKMNLHSKMESFYIRSTLSEIIKGGLEVKLPTMWIDGKAEVGRVREEKRRKEKKKEDQRRERVRGKKMQVREEVEKSRNTVFFKWFVTSWLRGVTFFSALCPAVGWLHVKKKGCERSNARSMLSYRKVAMCTQHIHLYRIFKEYCVDALERKHFLTWIMHIRKVAVNWKTRCIWHRKGYRIICNKIAFFQKECCISWRVPR